MTYIEQTCDNCGEYGDIICQDCKKRGITEYCYCKDCIEEHEEWHDQEEENTNAN